MLSNQKLNKVDMHGELITPSNVAVKAKQDTKKIIKVGLFTIFIAFFCFGSWAAFAPLRGAVLASGQVKVENSRKTIQHLEGGIVADILVKEGDTVKAGQTLVMLESTQVDAQVNLLQDQLAAEQANESRLLAEKTGAAKIRFSEALLAKSHQPIVAEAIRNETHIFNTRRASLNNEIQLMNNQIAEVKGEIAALNNQISASNKTTGYLEDELKINEKLAEKGFVAGPRLLEFKRSLSNQEDRKSEYSADIARAKQKINEQSLRIANLKHEYQTLAGDELKKSQEKIFDLQERLRVPQDAMSRQNITSPVEGRVVGLKVHTKGGVIGAREPIMDIVPQAKDLIIETKVAINDIDDLTLNMNAEVRLTAYKQRSTSLIQGKVIYIAADSFQDDPNQPPYYMAHVRVDGASLKEAGDNIILYPGMPAEVYILTSSRTAVEYLLDPITTTLQRSFREP